MDKSEIITTDYSNLFDSALRAKSSSPNKEATQRFMRSLLTEIYRAQDELHSRTWKISPLRPFIINERGHTRKIEGNAPYDRMIIHSYIDYSLYPALKPYLIYDNYASQKDKGVSLARDRFKDDLHKAFREYGTNEFYVLIMDFSKFYDNVEHQKLYDEIMRVLPHESFHEYMIWTILDSFKVDVSYMSDEEYANCLNEKYVALDHIHDEQKGEKYMFKSLNIGNHASQLFSIFYPTRIDNYFRVVKGISKHGRYMDDTFAISNDKDFLKGLIDEVDVICNSMGMFLNRRKTQIFKVNKGVKYLNRLYRMTGTGHLIENLCKETISRQRVKIRKLGSHVTTRTMSRDRAVNQIKCWKGSFYPYMTREQRNSMNLIIRRTGNV